MGSATAAAASGVPGRWLGEWCRRDTLAVRSGAAALAVRIPCIVRRGGGAVCAQPAAGGRQRDAHGDDRGQCRATLRRRPGRHVHRCPGGGRRPDHGDRHGHAGAAGTPVGGAQVSVLGRPGASVAPVASAADGSFAVAGVDVSRGSAGGRRGARAGVRCGAGSGAVTEVRAAARGNHGRRRGAAGRCRARGAVGVPGAGARVGIDGGGRRGAGAGGLRRRPGGGLGALCGRRLHAGRRRAGGEPGALERPRGGRRWAAASTERCGRWRSTTMAVAAWLRTVREGGDFLGGRRRLVARGVARWNGAAWSALGGGGGASGVAGSVYALAVYDDGLGGGPALCMRALRLQHGGGSGAAAANVARWRGGAWSAVGTGAGGASRRHGLRAGELQRPAHRRRGVRPRRRQGTAARSLAQWNGSAWSAVAYGTDSKVYASFQVWNGALYLGKGEDFTNAGLAQQPVYGIARWDGGSGWSGLAGGLQRRGSLRGSRRCRRCRRWRSTTTAQEPSSTPPASFWQAARPTSTQGAACWDGAAWTAVGSGFDTQGLGGGAALAVFDDGSGAGAMLYAGGGFNTAGVFGAHQVARWNGKTWSALGSGGTGADAGVAALAVFDDGAGAGPALYAGGDFTTVAGLAASHATRWDAAPWSQLGAGTDAPVSSLARRSPGPAAALYAGGGFAHAGGLPAGYLAAAGRRGRWWWRGDFGASLVAFRRLALARRCGCGGVARRFSGPASRRSMPAATSPVREPTWRAGTAARLVGPGRRRGRDGAALVILPG